MPRAARAVLAAALARSAAAAPCNFSISLDNLHCYGLLTSPGAATASMSNAGQSVVRSAAACRPLEFVSATSVEPFTTV
jgi:hypothetical protein